MLSQAQARGNPLASGEPVRPEPRTRAAQRGSGPTLEAASRLGHRFEARPRAPIDPPIQRVLANDQLHHLPQGLRDDLAPRILAFNQHIAAGPAIGQERAHRDEQLRMLHEIDQSANGYLRGPAHGITDDGRRALFRLAGQTETHHVEATRQAVQANDPLWLPAGVQGGARHRAQQLWTSLTAGTGNVRIQSARQGFHHETHAGFAKLLQGKHGRDLLSDLNAPQLDPEKRITISDDFGPHAAWQTHESFALGTASALRDEDRHSLRNTGPNQGTGSMVRILSEPPPATLEDHQTGVRGEAIHAPNFITLGHELGHARQNLRGTTLSQGWFGGEAVTDKNEQVRWTNPEEHRNITQDENELRREHNLPERRYHKTTASQRSEVARSEMTRQLEGHADSLPRGPLKAQVGQLHRDISRADLSDPRTIAAFRTRVSQTGRQVLWHRTKAFGKKALPYLGAAAAAGLGWAAYRYFGG